MIRTQIQLTEEQAGKLKRIASAERRSVAEIIRRAVDCFVAAKTGIDPEARKTRAIAATGRFRSGAGNVARDHDAHLAEVFSK